MIDDQSGGSDPFKVPEVDGKKLYLSPADELEAAKTAEQCQPRENFASEWAQDGAGHGRKQNAHCT